MNARGESSIRADSNPRQKIEPYKRTTIIIDPSEQGIAIIAIMDINQLSLRDSRNF